MSAYRVDDLQAVEPDALQPRDGISVEVTEEEDSMGFPRVAVTGPSADAVAAYVRDQWGDDDPDWFQEWVADRIEEVRSWPEASGGDGESEGDVGAVVHESIMTTADVYVDWDEDRLAASLTQALLEDE